MRYICIYDNNITRVKGRDDNIIYYIGRYFIIPYMYIVYNMHLYIIYIHTLYALYTRRSCSDAMMIYILYTCSDAINNADTSFCRAGKRFIDIIYRYRMSYITSICVCVCVCMRVCTRTCMISLCLGDFFDIY